MFYKVEYQKRAHQEIEKIFRVLLPEQGLTVREEQIRLCHEMLDTLLEKKIALCDAGVGIGKTYAYLIACVLMRKYSMLAGRFVLDYLDEKEMEIAQVSELAFQEQYEHFVEFLHWLKTGNHKDSENNQIPNNGTCNAYLKDVFRFFAFLELAEDMGRLNVLYYDNFSTHDAVGVKRKMRFRAFKGYLRAEERNVRAAAHNEIIVLLKQCTNCRDQLLIMLLAETGYRIGEILGVDYTKDIDYRNHSIRVYFRDDNENKARAKNAEYRKAKISDSTFQFLLFYLSEYRNVLQHQQMLFVTIEGESKGKALQVGAVYSMLDRMEKKTGIRTTPHMLRRYFGNMRREAGWPLEMISEAYGHRHIETTIRYLNIVDDELIEASDRYYEQHSALYDVQELL
ncbi:tyrosine-type recombinase/integrase [Blautia sp.]|uniref:tyrosine-type recombinase/integrase n=1 Tax=Blautia sp. TaxID=1955243 RepID=UPI002586DBEB|nr:tyrosine-type recombinase/integrase [Blautia sp.]